MEDLGELQPDSSPNTPHPAMSPNIGDLQCDRVSTMPTCNGVKIEPESGNDGETTGSLTFLDQFPAGIRQESEEINHELESDDSYVLDDDIYSASSSEGEDSAKKKKRVRQGDTARTNKPRTRKSAAKTAREYIKRLQEEEDRKVATAKGNKKRPPLSAPGASHPTAKRAKSNTGELPSDAIGAENLLRRMPENPELLEDISMNIRTSRKDEQLRQHMASIPEGCDTRRSKTQKRDLAEATKIFGYGKVKAHNGDWTLKGMKTGLKSYQLTAAAWKLKRELDRMPPYGGINADHMGMGKTVVMLTCIVGNPPEEVDLKSGRRATLIILPNAVMVSQWRGEIAKHCDEKTFKKIAIYKTGDGSSPKDLGECDIVLTTYSELTRSFPAVWITEDDAGKSDNKKDEPILVQKVPEEAGAIFKVPWYRVVLDEAHIIKNHRARTAKACIQLDSSYRWALTGTPLSNKIEELYPYLRFLRCEATGNLRQFRARYAKEDDKEASICLDLLVSRIAYRRTPRDSFMGRKILNLPSAKQFAYEVEPSDEEKLIFGMIRDDIRGEWNAIHKDAEKLSEEQLDAERKSVLKWGLNIYRYANSHPFQLESYFRNRASTEAIETLRQKLEELPKKPLYEQIGLKMAQPEQVCLEIESESSNPVPKQMVKGGQYDDDSKFGKSQFGGVFEMDSLLLLAQAETLVRDAERCPVCPPNAKTSSFLAAPKRNHWTDDGTNTQEGECPIIRPPKFASNAHMAACGDIVCQACIMRIKEKQPSSTTFVLRGLSQSRYHWGKKKTSEPTECPKCAKPLEFGQNLDTCSSVEKMWISEASVNKSFVLKGRDFLGINNIRPTYGHANSFFMETDMTKSPYLVPSTKTTAVKDIVLSIQQQKPEDKAIVFTEFLKTGNIIGRMLRMEGVPFVYHYGNMSPKQKEDALTAFRENKTIKLMVAGLGCTSQALNITTANHVIIVDPWWNRGREEQAFGRTWRFGQTKDCYLYRIYTRGSSDDAIRDIQDQKSAVVRRVMQDDGHTPVVPTMRRLMRLFFGNEQPEVKGHIRNHRVGADDSDQSDESSDAGEEADT